MYTNLDRRTASTLTGTSPYRNPISSSSGPGSVQALRLLQLAYVQRSAPAPEHTVVLTSHLVDLAPLFDRPQPNDVRIFFLRSSAELWANSSILSAASPYFKDLFTSGFSEGQKGGERKRRKVDTEEHEAREQDSDDELDSRRPPPKVNELLPAPLEFYEVIVTDAAYSTYRAVLVWIYTSGNITFLPSRSSYGPKDNPESVSPKSVYRLAHFLDIPKLRTLALATLTPMIHSMNAALELFSESSWLYPEVQAMLLQFVVTNWSTVKESPAMREIERKLDADEDVPMGGAIMLKLMKMAAERAATERQRKVVPYVQVPPAISAAASRAPGANWSDDW